MAPSLVGVQPVALGEWVGSFQGLTWVGVADSSVEPTLRAEDAFFRGSFSRAEASMKLIEDVPARTGVTVIWHDASLPRRRGFATRGV